MHSGPSGRLDITVTQKKILFLRRASMQRSVQIATLIGVATLKNKRTRLTHLVSIVLEPSGYFCNCPSYSFQSTK